MMLTDAVRWHMATCTVKLAIGNIRRAICSATHKIQNLKCSMHQTWSALPQDTDDQTSEYATVPQEAFGTVAARPRS